VFSTRYLPLRFTCSAVIGHWSSGCHNNNRFAMLSKIINNKSYCNLDNRNMLRKVTVKIGPERIDT